MCLGKDEGGRKSLLPPKPLMDTRVSSQSDWKRKFAYFCKARGVTKYNAVREALDLVGCPIMIKKLFTIFCGQRLGQRLRSSFGHVMHEPELLILDEPINGLDPIGIVGDTRLFTIYVIPAAKQY